MKKDLTTLILLFLFLSTAVRSEIIFSKNINLKFSQKIEKDLKILDGFVFKEMTSSNASKVLKLNIINAESVSNWLNARIHFIVEENVFSFFNLEVLNILSVSKSDVEYPYANSIPYSLFKPQTSIAPEQNDQESNEKKLTIMSNLSAAIYIEGKSKKELYAFKISRGLLRRPYNVKITSPKVGIIQIGEGLFNPEYAVNSENPEAISNNIQRLATLFHEARHSDGNGKSLGFAHAVCPQGHDYEGSPACDENLNGPYTIEKLMLFEMSNSYEECSERDKQLLKLFILDSANRILKKTHSNEASTNWDDRSEALLDP